MACVREETFGPVVPLIEFQDEEEVIEDEGEQSSQFKLPDYLLLVDDGTYYDIDKLLFAQHEDQWISSCCAVR